MRARVAFLLVLCVFASCAREPEPERPDVVLIVLDTVRVDRVGACGGSRGTTPYFDELSSRGALFCEGTTPGSWTLPVHASIFTGELPVVHKAHFILEPEEILPGFEVMWMSKMREDLPTLAELFSEAGYRTVLVSGNPILHPSLGVTRGFDVTKIAEGFETGDAARVADDVTDVLETSSDAGKPLFLVVNIILAHGPFEQDPSIDPRRQLPENFNVYSRPIENSLFYRLANGRMPGPERRTLLALLREAYDRGVRLADDDLRETMKALADHGISAETDTIVITSDHGEHLGEYGLLDHGRSVVDEDIDTFALALGPGFSPGARSAVLFQSQDLYPSLLRAAGIQGERKPWSIPIQEQLAGKGHDRTAVTISYPDRFWELASNGRFGIHRAIAVRSGSERVYWINGVFLDGPVPWAGSKPVDPSAIPEELRRQVRRLATEMHVEGEAAAAPDELKESLRGLGYLQ